MSALRNVTFALLLAILGTGAAASLSRGHATAGVDWKTVAALGKTARPVAVAAFPGGAFAVLDGAVLEFDAQGRRTGELAAAGELIDIVADAPGSYWLLSIGPDAPAVIHVQASKEARRFPIPGVSRKAVLWALARDAAGTLYILDRNDGSLLRMDARGQALPALPGLDSRLPILDGSARFYSVQLAGKSTRELALTRRSEASTDVLAGFRCDQEATAAEVVGVDGLGNAYVQLALGTAETLDRCEIRQFDSQGKAVGTVRAPADPIEPAMTRCKAVAADGTLVAIVAAEDGLCVQTLSGGR